MGEPSSNNNITGKGQMGEHCRGDIGRGMGLVGSLMNGGIGIRFLSFFLPFFLAGYLFIV